MMGIINQVRLRQERAEEMKDQNTDGCEICGETARPLIHVFGCAMCDDCAEFEQAFDWDAYEQEKRERIAESQEY